MGVDYFTNRTVISLLQLPAKITPRAVVAGRPNRREKPAIGMIRRLRRKRTHIVKSLGGFWIVVDMGLLLLWWLHQGR